MNRNRMLVLLIAALAMSGVVTFLLYRVIQSRILPREESTQIVVAVEKLPKGTRITEKNIRLTAWPRSMPLEGSFSSLEPVLERSVIAPIFPNEPILDSRLAAREAGAGLASTIPDGMRAVSVKVNDVSGVAGFVLPDTFVDVIMAGTPREGADMAARVILEKVQVLTAGQNIEQDANGEPKVVPVVTLLVTPEQTQELALASVEDRIQLALRNPLDEETRNPNAVHRQTLFAARKPPEAEQPVQPKAAPVKAAPSQKRAPAEVVVPPPAPEPVFVMDVYLGNKKETISFKQNIKRRHP